MSHERRIETTTRMMQNCPISVNSAEIEAFIYSFIYLHEGYKRLRTRKKL